MTTTDTDLTKVTVNFTARSMAAPQDASTRNDDTHTDTINRAVQMYAVVSAATSGERVVYDHRGGYRTLTVRDDERPAPWWRTVAPEAYWFVIACLLVVAAVLAVTR